MKVVATFAILALLSAQLEFISDAKEIFSVDATGASAAVVHDNQVDHHFSSTGGEPSDEGIEHDSCDHCCHGASHLTAIGVDQAFASTRLHASAQTTKPGHLVSIFLTPPLPPPIA
jgi:hypothetical protein